MEHARIALFEDYEPMRKIITFLAEIGGHEVRAQAGNMAEAMSLIESLSPDDIDIAVVDGNLEPGTSNGYDGAVISRLLKEKFSEVIVIGFSASDDVEGADFNISKAAPSGSQELTEFIGEL